MRVFVSAGEVSGDLILAQILPLLRQRHPGLELCGFGGPASARQGLRPLLPMAEMAINGAGDVLRKAFFCLGMYRLAMRSLRDFRPHLALLVDYPGLNLRLAERARALSIPVYYVAPPQAWVYKNPGAKSARSAAALAGAHVHWLFPFEAAGFAAAGNPDVADNAKVSGRVLNGHFLAPGNPGRSRRDLLCLCPGSRLPVLKRNLPRWLEALARHGVLPAAGGGPGSPEVEVLVPDHLEAAARDCARGYPVRVATDKARMLAEARWAIAFPGTVTLELALHRVPTLVLALLDPLTWALGRRFLRGPLLGLPNLLWREEVFPEWAGTASAWGRVDFGRRWRSFREGEWDWETLSARLETAIGPGQGARIAAEACGDILNNHDKLHKIT